MLQHLSVPSFAPPTPQSNPGIDVPVTCRGCPPEVPCVKACPKNALSVNRNTGSIEVDSKVCTSCGSCAKACPAKAITFHPVEHYPLICDLCGGNPQCVVHCTSNTLEFRVGPAYIFGEPGEKVFDSPERIFEALKKTVYLSEKRNRET